MNQVILRELLLEQLILLIVTQLFTISEAGISVGKSFSFQMSYTNNYWFFKGNQHHELNYTIIAISVRSLHTLPALVINCDFHSNARRLDETHSCTHFADKEIQDQMAQPYSLTLKSLVAFIIQIF